MNHTEKNNAIDRRKVLLIGADSEIGKEIVPYFSNNGYSVIPHYFKDKIENGYYANIQKPAEVETLVRKVLEKNNSIDILINCAGISIDKIAHKYEFEDWKKTIDINLNGAFYCMRAILPSMQENKYGRIINISSVVSRIGVPGTVAYGASKAGLNALTRTIAIENITRGITCNSIALGYVNAGLTTTLPRSIQNQILEKIPMKRFCEIEEVFNTIVFIIKTPYITGQTIDLNGGLFLI